MTRIREEEDWKMHHLTDRIQVLTGIPQ